MGAGIEPLMAGGRSRRWAAALVGAVVVLGGIGGLATGAGAQDAPAAPPAPGPEARVPPDNVFPVPLPFEVSFSDSWHACRDGCSRQHKGNDLMAAEGTPAVAVESGTIARVDNTDDGNGGLSLWLLGDSGVAYYYAHNSQNLVVEDQRVTRGQMIARVGRTGNARTTPPHIHFQINVCGELSSDEPCTINPHPHLQRWAQALVDGGADGVGWYEGATGAFGRRTDAGSPLPAFPFGTPGAEGVVPVAGDWDGDGRDSVGLYQRADATFHLRDDEGAALPPLPFGQAGRPDVWPIAGDFDGDGRDTVGLYRQAEAQFAVLVDVGVESPPVTVGTPGRTDALPLVGDWDGNGRDSLGVFQQADAAVVRVDDAGRPLEPTTAGAPGLDSFPVVGDWGGDGRDDVGVLRRDAGAFELPAPTLDDPAAVRTVEVEGGPGVLPVAGDWNGHDVVTLEELRQIYGDLPDEAKVAESLPGLNAAMLQAGVSTPARKAAFLATIRHESGFRFDAVEAGNDDRYRGRGFIQITGEHNYGSAGEFLDLDLLGNPDIAVNPLASPAIAAWYWTVARNINVAADELDMAAVNIAIGFAPSERRDMLRCGDFLAALRYYSGGTVPDGVNCERTARSRVLAFAPSLLTVTEGSSRNASTGDVSVPPSSVPADWTPSGPTSTAPPDPATFTDARPDPAVRRAPPTSATTVPVPPPAAAPPSTGRPPTSTTAAPSPTPALAPAPTSAPATPTTAAPTTAAPTTSAPTSTTAAIAPPTSAVSTSAPTTSAPATSTTAAGSTTTSSTPASDSTTTTGSTTTTSVVDPDATTSTTLLAPG